MSAAAAVAVVVVVVVVVSDITVPTERGIQNESNRGFSLVAEGFL